MTSQVAQILWSQLTLATKMACGMRQVVGARNGLTCKVGRGQTLAIELDPDDTYTVRLYKGLAKLVEEHTGIYCDQLNEVVYHAVNK
jgi:hypothetical protein